MDKTITRFILRYSAKQQLVVVALTLVSWPVLYATLELPKSIVNEAIGDKIGWARQVIGAPLLGEPPDKISFLLILCLGFLIFVVANGVIKFLLNVYAGRLGEQMLRRLRFQLYSRVLRFPLPQFKKVSQGEIIPMITAEVEPLGGYIGYALSIPMFFGGMLLVYLGFIFAQDVFLGLAAVALYPLQIYVIPKLQAKVIALGRRRVREVRSLADKIGESIGGVTEIHAHDTSVYERSDITRRLDRIYLIRYEIFRRKFAIKFLNSFMAQLTPFFFYSIGGYFVIRGQLSIGALVAVLAAYKDLSAPWKELLNYYQLQADVKVKYEQVIEQFDPPDMLDPTVQDADEGGPEAVAGELQGSNVTYSEDGRAKSVEGVNFAIDLKKHVAIVGAGGSGKDDFTLLLARLIQPTGGQLRLGEARMDTLPESFIGRRMSYMGVNPYLFSTSVRDNLIYGLKHRPGPSSEDEEAARERGRYIRDAQAAGNFDHDPNADWTDYVGAGADSQTALSQRAIEVLKIVDMGEDLYQFGLRGSIDPAVQPKLAEDILRARHALRETLSETGQANLVEPFDQAKYNSNATLGENLLFGTPRDNTFDIDRLADHPYVASVIEEVGLTRDLVVTGRQLAETMIELFSGLPPGHEFFEQYSFIASDELPEYQQLVARTAGLEPDAMRPEDRQRFLSLPLKLIPARHRLDLITEEIQDQVLEARHRFAEGLPEELRDSVEFFDPDAYNGAATLQDNILFGKVAYGQAQAPIKISVIVGEVLDSLDMRDEVMTVGLSFQVGVAGARLSAAQRQKLGLARCIIKRPDLMIINEGITSLDGASQRRVMEAVLKEFEGRGLIWTLHRTAYADQFDEVIVMRSGKIVEQDDFKSLDRDGTVLRELINTE
jgi:putative ABC transport system ATP-binding protein